MKLSAPVRLEKFHIPDEFDCGQPVLNQWLCKYALLNQQAGAANTFAVHIENRIIAYYSLAVGAVEHAIAPARIRKGLARHPIPVMILARLAVDIRFQGKRIGHGLLRDAVIRTLMASEYAGIRAIFVHAKDDRACAFYKQFDFIPSPVNSLKLMLLIKDARKTIESL